MFIQSQRTNNILERFFRDIKRQYRKRSGTVSLNRTLKAMLAQTPLIKNLENEEYLKILLNGCNTLEERFSQIDSKLVIEELRKAKLNRDKISPEMKQLITKENLPQKINSLFLTEAR